MDLEANCSQFTPDKGELDDSNVPDVVDAAMIQATAKIEKPELCNQQPSENFDISTETDNLASKSYENTAQSATSETSEAVKALEGCFGDFADAGVSTVCEDVKEEHGQEHEAHEPMLTNETEAEGAFSSESDNVTVPSNVVSSSSLPDACEMNDSMNPTTSVENTLMSPSQVLNFDENAQYKVEESVQSNGKTVQPEFEPINFTHVEESGINKLDKRGEKSTDSIAEFSSVTANNVNVNSNDESPMKQNDERSVCSSVPPAFEDRSEISENSLIAFPEKVAATSSINGDLSSDADFMTKNITESTQKSENSNDIMMTCVGTADPIDNSFSTEPTQVPQPTQTPSTSISNQSLSYPAENLLEYQWPMESGAEWYMLQEQLCEFLNIKSFKRKYPELNRRVPAQEEKEYLKSTGVTTETQADLGLTALRADEVHDLMMRDYPARYKEYAKVLHEKEKQTHKEKLKSYGPPKMDKAKFAAYLKKAVKSASDFNTQFQRERREERRAYLDLQTMAIHYPASKRKVLPPESTKPSAYPVSLMPGQYQDYYKTYTPDELKYLPINTALYGPPKTFTAQQTLDLSTKAALEEDDEEDEKEEVKTDAVKEKPEIVSEPKKEEKEKEAEQIPVVVEKKDTPVKPVIEKVKPKVEETRCRVCEMHDDADPATKDLPPPTKNPKKADEEMVKCSECSAYGHPTCLDLTPEMLATIKTYPWQCMDCKTCVECTDPFDEDKMMFCDRCDRGYHTFCVGLRGLPTGRWECRSCSMDPPRQKKPRKERSDKGMPKKMWFQMRDKMKLKQLKEREMRDKQLKDDAGRNRPSMDRDAKDGEVKDRQSNGGEVRHRPSRDRDVKDRPSRESVVKERQSKDGEINDRASCDSAVKDGESRDDDIKDRQSRDDMKDGQLRDSVVKDNQSRDGDVKDRQSRDGDLKNKQSKDGNEEDMQSRDDIKDRQTRDSVVQSGDNDMKDRKSVDNDVKDNQPMDSVMKDSFVKGPKDSDVKDIQSKDGEINESNDSEKETKSNDITMMEEEPMTYLKETAPKELSTKTELVQ